MPRKMSVYTVAARRSGYRTGDVVVRAIAIATEQRMKLEESLGDRTSVAVQSETNGLWVTGDSVILGIKSALAKRHTVSLVNAHVGRQAPELLQAILHDRASAPDGPVVLNMGNNNALTEQQIVDILDALRNEKKVILVNTAVPRPWRDGNNQLISRISARYFNVRVIDWAAISEGHPEYFAPDGVHLVPTGVAVYVEEIARYLP